MDEPFSSEVLRLDVAESIATLWLDRPAAGNAMGPAFWSDLPRAMAEVAQRDDVRVVVVAARGSHFCVGLDLKAMGSLVAGQPAAGDDRPLSHAARSGQARHSIRGLQAAISSVAECPKPVLAAVHGYCIGGGVDLIAACDIRLASADAMFSVREAKMAIVADLGSLQRLPKIIGSGQLAELAYTGKDIGADRARDIALVNDVLPDAEAAQTAARSLAAEIAANSPLAVQGTKAMLAANDGRTVAEGLAYVATWNAAMLHSEDLQEAMTAFFEKRSPRFQGR